MSRDLFLNMYQETLYTNIHSSTVLVTKKSVFYLDYLSTMHRLSELRCTGEYQLRLHIKPDECQSNAGNISKSQNIQIDLLTLKVKNLPAMQETQLQSLEWEAPLEKGMATHSSILAWRIPWTEEPVTGRLQSLGSQ